MSLAPERVRDAVAAYYAAVGVDTIDTVAAMFAPDAPMRDPVGLAAVSNDAARRERYEGIAAAFASFAITPVQVAVCGDEAAASWTARGVTKAGREVTFAGISTFTFDAEGRIAAMSAYWEPAAVAAAMAG